MALTNYLTATLLLIAARCIRGQQFWVTGTEQVWLTAMAVCAADPCAPAGLVDVVAAPDGAGPVRAPVADGDVVGRRLPYDHGARAAALSTASGTGHHR